MNEKKQIRRQRLHSFIHNFGKFVIDAAKLCFGSMVLGSVIRGEIPQATLITSGIIATSAGAIIGILMVIFTKEK